MMKSTDTSTRNAAPQCRQHVPGNVWEMIDKARDVNETADCYANLTAPQRKAVFVLGNILAEGNKAGNMQKLEAKDLFTAWQDLPVARRRTIAYGMESIRTLAELMPPRLRPADITRDLPDITRRPPDS